MTLPIALIAALLALPASLGRIQENHQGKEKARVIRADRIAACDDQHGCTVILKGRN